MEYNDIELEEIKKTHPEYSLLFAREFCGSIIQYGIIKGNNKILFIKPGQDGSLVGYKDKYYNLAKYINKKYGMTVISSNNPYIKPYNPLDDAMQVINAYVKEMNYDEYEVYYLGNSCGGMLGARYSYLYSCIKNALLINPPLMINFHKMKDGVEEFDGKKLVFIYGSKDPSMNLIGLLDVIENKKVAYDIIEGEDHNFSKNKCSLEYLVEKYLINE